MPFLRVRSARSCDPQHEFDAAVPEVEANLDLYEVLDPEPVDYSRPPTYVERATHRPRPSARKAAKPAARAQRRTAPQTPAVVPAATGDTPAPPASTEPATRGTNRPEGADS